MRATVKWLSKKQNQSNRVITFDSRCKLLKYHDTRSLYSNLLNTKNYKQCTGDKFKILLFKPQQLLWFLQLAFHIVSTPPDQQSCYDRNKLCLNVESFAPSTLVINIYCEQWFGFILCATPLRLSISSISCLIIEAQCINPRLFFLVRFSPAYLQSK